jgi:hypothetical protein
MSERRELTMYNSAPFNPLKQETRLNYIKQFRSCFKENTARVHVSRLRKIGSYCEHYMQGTPAYFWQTVGVFNTKTKNSSVTFYLTSLVNKSLLFTIDIYMFRLLCQSYLQSKLI